jgi:phosphoserine phosphatase
MAIGIEELEKKRLEANARADGHRAKRDELNAEVRQLMDRRAALFSELRAKSDEARSKREDRDHLNEAVREAKRAREEWNGKASALSERLRELRMAHDGRRGAVSLWRLLKDLEFKHMTSSLSREAEERLISEMQRIQREIKAQEESFRKNPEVAKVTHDLQEAHELAEKHHKEVEEFAVAAQKNHEDMARLYEEVDKLRSEMDELQAKVLEIKNASDEAHRAHITAIEEVRDIEKMLFAAKRRAPGEEAGEEGENVEEGLFLRFKKGGKISTEDLMALQKGGKE